MWIVILNGKAGAAAQTKALAMRIEALFRTKGVVARVRPVRGEALLEAAARACREEGVGTIVAAGGDGTVSAVAQAVRGTGIPMAVLPLGTRNHFARDLGIPLDLEKAVEAAVTGRVKRVDVGDVNGHVFVNNSCVGLYPDLVSERERHRWRRRLGKKLATVRAAWRVLAEPRLRRFLLSSRERSVRRQAAFVFVGNNDYAPRAFGSRMRERLDGGELSLWVPRTATSRWGAVKLATRVALGRLRGAKDLERRTLPEIWVDVGERRVRVSADGEVLTLQAPLHYRVLPRALEVRAP